MIIIHKEQVYIQLEPKINIEPNQLVKLNDLATVVCLDKNLQESLLDINILKTPSEKRSIVISVIDIIKKIKQKHNNIDIVVFGNPEILVNIREKFNSPNIFQFIKIAIVCIILAIGAATAIIYFHEDVNMKEVHKQIFYLITGETSEKPLILQVPYSLGIGLGIATFFNHLFKKKWKKEPSPLDIEMYLYSKNIDDYILDESKSSNSGS